MTSHRLTSTKFHAASSHTKRSSSRHRPTRPSAAMIALLCFFLTLFASPFK